MHRWRWSRLSPSTILMLANSYSSSWVDISISNIRQFWLISGLNVDDHVILHMHLLMLCYHLFLLLCRLYFDQEILYSFKRYHSAPYRIAVKFPSMAGKGLIDQWLVLKLDSLLFFWKTFVLLKHLKKYQHPINIFNALSRVSS